MASATLPGCFFVDNGTTNTDIVVGSGSLALFSEGLITRTGVPDSFSQDITASATESSVFSIRAKTTFGAHLNHVQTFLQYITASFSSSGNKNCTVRIRRGATLATPTWTDVGLTSSQLEVDTAGTVTGGTGDVLFTFTVTANASVSTSLDELDLVMNSAEIITVTAQTSSGTGDLSVSMNVLEDM
jgi:hypothetical protein